MGFRPSHGKTGVTDEAQLIEAARRGSAEATSTLYRRYYPLAWQWAYALAGERSRADDVAQDAILRAFGALDRFDAERPLGPWLRRIVLNVGRDELRRLRRSALGSEWMTDRGGNDFAAVRRSDAVVDAVRALSPARRVVVVLHYWLDLPIDAIAAELDIPYGTAASRLSRALADLERALAEQRV
jgi:RNA polymerase sigma-70 factor (ECF subfamily)